MIKKLMCILLSVVLLLSIAGCPNSAKESEVFELSANQKSEIEGLVKFEIVLSYGYEPEITISDIDAQEGNSDFSEVVFTVKGDYTLTVMEGDVYTGSFSMDGHMEAHGASIDNSEISAPTNGKGTLPLMKK